MLGARTMTRLAALLVALALLTTPATAQLNSPDALVGIASFDVQVIVPGSGVCTVDRPLVKEAVLGVLTREGVAIDIQSPDKLRIEVDIQRFDIVESGRFVCSAAILLMAYSYRDMAAADGALLKNMQLFHHISMRHVVRPYDAFREAVTVTVEDAILWVAATWAAVNQR